MQTTGEPQNQDGQVTVCQEVLKRATTVLERSCGQMRQSVSDGNSKVWRRREGTAQDSIPRHLCNMMVGVLWFGHVWLLKVLAYFIDVLTAGGSTNINSEVYSAVKKYPLPPVFK